jgi:LmbE family N-acetylglucosaminyl deacetylase
MTALAICCHPDDMEMMMSGTLLLLKQAGCAVHLINLANGSAGSAELRPEEIAALRWKEARADRTRYLCRRRLGERCLTVPVA